MNETNMKQPPVIKGPPALPKMIKCDFCGQVIMYEGQEGFDEAYHTKRIGSQPCWSCYEKACRGELITEQPKLNAAAGVMVAAIADRAGYSFLESTILGGIAAYAFRK